MRCPNCGIEIENPRNFCHACGARLAPKMCPNGHIMSESDSVCPQCATTKQPKVRTIAPEDKGKTLFEINTSITPAKNDNAVKEFDVRKTKVVKTEVPEEKVLMGWLVSYERRPEGEDFRLYSCENTIGASPACNIVIDDDTVSSRHAIITFKEGRFYIRDLNSTNGTFLNGIRLDKEALLSDGDYITFGTFKAIFIQVKRK